MRTWARIRLLGVMESAESFSMPPAGVKIGEAVTLEGAQCLELNKYGFSSALSNASTVENGHTEAQGDSMGREAGDCDLVLALYSPASPGSSPV